MSKKKTGLLQLLQTTYWLQYLSALMGDKAPIARLKGDHPLADFMSTCTTFY